MAMVVTARNLLLTLYVVAGVLTITVFLKPYGGWHGNVDDEDIAQMISSYDTVNPEYVFFNRWLVPMRSSPEEYYNWLERKLILIFFFSNLPAFTLAVLIDKGLFYLSYSSLYPTFAVPKFPLGLSTDSYFLISFSIWGAVQWFLIGTLIDKWRERRRKRNEEI